MTDALEIRSVARNPDGVDGYFASPGAVPAGLILIPEYWGLVDHIKDVTRRTAKAGFVSLGVDLFEGKTAETPDEGRRLAASLDHDHAVESIRAAVEHVRSQTTEGRGKVGVIGWCMGGTLAFRCGADEVGDAAVGLYGRPPEIERIVASSVPILGVFGEADHVYPADDVRRWAATLREASTRSRFVLAKDAKHAFFNDTRDSYDADTAAWAWELTLLWFRYWLGVPIDAIQ